MSRKPHHSPEMIYQPFNLCLFNDDHRSLYVRHNVPLVVMKQLESVDIYLAQTPDESGLFQASVVTAKARLKETDVKTLEYPPHHRSDRAWLPARTGKQRLGGCRSPSPGIEERIPAWRTDGQARRTSRRALGWRPHHG